MTPHLLQPSSQEKIEPPVYVSDRRLVKAIQLLQVAAYCNGRDSVTEYDVLLLQHVLWQRPDNADRIADWVLAQLSADDGTKQVSCVCVVESV
jgi:MoxR-like ATPase